MAAGIIRLRHASNRGAARHVVVFAILAAMVTLASSWSWLVGPNSPLRTGDIETVEAWAPKIIQACDEANLEDPFLLAGLIYAESRGLADAVSSVGALGLCQLMPSTAQEIAMSVQVDGPPYPPSDNLRMGANYLARMMRHRKGDVDLALLSYRLGPGRVSRGVSEAGGAEEFKQMLQAKPRSAWGYRNQVIEMRDRFRQRAEQGQEAWIGWAGPQ